MIAPWVPSSSWRGRGRARSRPSASLRQLRAALPRRADPGRRRRPSPSRRRALAETRAGTTTCGSPAGSTASRSSRTPTTGRSCSGGPASWRAVRSRLDDRSRTRARPCPFVIREGLDAIAIDSAALADGLVVVPRESRRPVAGDLGDRAPAGMPAATPVRVDHRAGLERVDHAIVLGVPATAASGGAVTLTAGLGRPLILTTLETDEAMRILAGGANAVRGSRGACLGRGAVAARRRRWPGPWWRRVGDCDRRSSAGRRAGRASPRSLAAEPARPAEQRRGPGPRRRPRRWRSSRHRIAILADRRGDGLSASPTTAR